MNRQVEIAKEHKRRSGPMEDKLPLNVRHVSTTSPTVDTVTGQHQDEGAAAIESD